MQRLVTVCPPSVGCVSPAGMLSRSGSPKYTISFSPSFGSVWTATEHPGLCGTLSVWVCTFVTCFVLSPSENWSCRAAMASRHCPRLEINSSGDV